MKRSTRQLLNHIGRVTGSSRSAQGFALFDAQHLPAEIRARADVPIEDLHCVYDYATSVRYLARMCPADALAIEEETNVDCSAD